MSDRAIQDLIATYQITGRIVRAFSVAARTTQDQQRVHIDDSRACLADSYALIARVNKLLDEAAQV